MPVSDRLLADVAIVRQQGYAVDVIDEGTRIYVIVRDVQLPDGYRPNMTNILIVADYQYPMSALDMFWTEPHITCQSGEWPTNANQFETHLGREWQRWSWHYAGWNPSTHSVVTHLEVCFDRLAKRT